MTKLGKIFDVKYGVNLELNHMSLDPNGINFVSRTTKNNGVSAKISRLPETEPIEAGVITVAGGGSVLEAFVQPEPFYSGRDMYYLRPLVSMTDAQKLYYCACIRANKYRYNYGRQANKTLGEISLPNLNDIPTWVNQANVNMFNGAEVSCFKNSLSLNVSEWSPFKLQDLFNIERGRGPRRKDLNGTGHTPFITATDSNNGFTEFSSTESLHNGNTIGVNRNGSVGEAFYQPVPFCSTEDVHILIPRQEWANKMNAAIGLFLATVIRQEKYRFNYGRKWGIERMKVSTIYLPSKAGAKPDWDFMERYIKSLPYSGSI